MPGFELIGREEKEAVIEVFEEGGILFAHGFDSLRKKIWYAAPLVSSIIGSVTDTFLFFSIAFYATGIPWVTLAFGDLAVKLFIALVMLIPFRLLINKIEDFSESSASEIKN